MDTTIQTASSFYSSTHGNNIKSINCQNSVPLCNTRVESGWIILNLYAPSIYSHYIFTGESNATASLYDFIHINKSENFLCPAADPMSFLLDQLLSKIPVRPFLCQGDGQTGEECRRKIKVVCHKHRTFSSFFFFFLGFTFTFTRFIYGAGQRNGFKATKLESKLFTLYSSTSCISFFYFVYWILVGVPGMSAAMGVTTRA